MLLAICVRRSKREKSVRRGRTRSRDVRHYRRIHSREEMLAAAPMPSIPQVVESGSQMCILFCARGLRRASDEIPP